MCTIQNTTGTTYRLDAGGELGDSSLDQLLLIVCELAERVDLHNALRLVIHTQHCDQHKLDVNPNGGVRTPSSTFDEKKSKS